MFNWFKGLFLGKGANMSKLENSMRTVVVSLLQDLEKNYLEVGRFFTLGKVSDPKLEAINNDILRIVKMLHSVVDIVHPLIPESMVHLHKWMDLSEEIYHNVVEPALK